MKDKIRININSQKEKYIDEFKKVEKNIFDIAEEIIVSEIEGKLDKDNVNSFVLSINLYESEKIRELNKEYRGKDKTTDVISFPDSSIDSSDNSYQIGDIFVNMDILEEQSKGIGSNKQTELVFLIMHSFLHLVGYKHDTDEEWNKMKKREKEIFTKLNIRGKNER